MVCMNDMLYGVKYKSYPGLLLFLTAKSMSFMYGMQSCGYLIPARRAWCAFGNRRHEPDLRRSRYPRYTPTGRH